MTKRKINLVVCMLLLIPASIDAQGIGGRLRQRAQDAVSGDKKADQTEIDKSKVFINDVVEISEAAMKGFQVGIETEIRLLTEFATLLDTYKSPEEYERCQQEIATSPEAMEIFNLMASIPDNATAEEIQRINEKMNEQFAALMKKKCGPSIVEDWPQSKRAERLREIATKAAAAAGPVRPPEPVPSGGPSSGDDESYTFPRQQQGMTLQAYIIFKERVNAYCAFKKLKGDSMPVTPGDGYNLSFPASALDGSSNPAMWIFTADEVRQMDDHCDGLVVQIGKITQIIEMAPINIYGKRN